MGAGLKIRRDDMVIVLSGDDRGKTGKVLEVYPKRQRVLVEGVNLIKRAIRKTQDNPRGGIIEREAPIHVSNVMRLDRYRARHRSDKASGDETK